MEITVSIDDNLLERVRALALNEGLTLQLLIEEGLRAALAARTSQTSGPFQLRDGSFHGGGLQPGCNWTDLTKLA